MSNPNPAPVPLDETLLLAAAEAATGLQDWGDDLSFKTGLTILLDSLNGLNPPPALAAGASMRILGILTARLHLVDDERKHPEVLDIKIERPVVIIGLPRTGTTVTYDLLALDPASRYPRNWEWAMPWPAPEEATFTTDSRIAMLDGIFAHLLAGAPDLAKIQDITASHAGECNLGFTHHFASTDLWAEWQVPEYTEWLRGPRIPNRYKTHKRLLQQFQWKGPKGRWTIKSPEHLLDLEGLIGTYPDACLVWTHRDPVLAFSSLSSMVLQFRKVSGVGADPKTIGREIIDIWSVGLERATASRAADKNIDRAVIDISHRDVIKDRVDVVRRIHDYFNLPFTPEFEQRLRGEAVEAATGRLGLHSHVPAEFGIHADEVRERLPTYYQRFGELF
ncbi:MAG: hypothetical protein JWM78_3480 [Verrucomicrobiaceae bacterium]|nr:hypothetical protein [Verrucomicrobiaceae bacterium]